MAKPLTRFLVLTFDPAHPKTAVPVGRGDTLEAVREVYRKLRAKADDWAHVIVDTWNGYAPVPAEG